MNYKPVVIIIEGVDRSGKSTLQKELDKITDYKNIIIIRGPLGFKAFNQIFKKGVPEKYYNELEDGFKKMRHLLVYLYAPREVLEKRLGDERTYLRDKKTFKEYLKVHNDLFDKSKLVKCTFDTNFNTVQEICERIIASLVYIYPDD